ncbi:aspartic peptidase domain-containing protein [Xylaria nigripes]|nr:aspartic peptidase domain-containing protein [Xylaria nigripes]
MVKQSTTIALAAALAGTAAAFPTINGKNATPARSFTVNRVANPLFKPHGPLQLAKAYNKFGAKLPDGLAQTITNYKASRNAKRDSGSAVTSPEQSDIEYLTPVEIGTPPQTLHLDFDSGSSDLWVFSTETDPFSVNGQRLYDPSSSTTAENVDGAIWSISYGDGSSSSGSVYHDVVNVGGVVVKSQGVESASTVSSQFTQDSDNDGLLGLGFSVINSVIPKQEKTWFENALDFLDAPVWTADLKYHAPGTYDFGFIDSSKYHGEISYVNVNNIGGFWDFSAKINGQSISGIADTGTTLLLLPDDIVDNYYSQIDGVQFDNTQGGYVFPCDSPLPDFTFQPGDTTVSIPGQFMNYAPIDAFDIQCFGGLQSNSGIGLAIYGDIALKAAFVVFDVSNGLNSPRIGWANKDL